MTPHRPKKARHFAMVEAIGLTLPGVERAVRYDGSPVLQIDGCFMAGLATHPSAEPATLVIRAELDDRDTLIEDAPDVYYLTDYYRRYPLVLVRLSRIDRDALRDLLNGSRRLTLPKTRLGRRVNPETARIRGSRTRRAVAPAER
jgi:hypothetical protein